MKDIQFPITVQSVSFDSREVYRPSLLFGGKCGDFVSVRPCGDKYGKKTYLGILIGEVALSQGVQWHEAEGRLEVARYMHNPMIFIPELSDVVWGCGSWWGKIKDEAQLRQITDNDIENVWYVRALKQLSERATDPTTAGGSP
jgi:hypothetical protein